ncbi:MAG: baseplate J/gp47 family protein [Nostoc sp.]|uniref:baseplate J/gp47 family protein n=1 Tax=Nostoc sp. TaxID=1180 RepID=UPI002FF75602
MVFERKDFAQIFQAMRDRSLPNLTDFQEGSVVRTMFESFAYEMALLYAQMEKVYLSAYVDTAEGVQLEQVVAILGIKRGEPDFATGKVAFIRDIGIDENIVIPIGTLIATSEDTPESPKKVYKTIEAQTLTRDIKAIDVRVQAVQHGESQKTDAETITVMPQPITGVKSVINQEAILFTGKRQETDKELRDRAKKTLLAASGANTTAIEQALISLPGVKQVQVRENFHKARGEVTLNIDGNSQTVIIPKDTEIKIGQNSFKTTEKVTINNSSPVKVNVHSVVDGQAGELLQATNKPTINNIQNISIQAINHQQIVLKDFGIIEVFVDGIDFRDTGKVSELNQEIERVRAAGIYVILKQALTVTINGVFKIELVNGLKLPKPEIIKLEEEIQKVIKSHIIKQAMGQPLLISQFTRQVLEINGVNDIADFILEVKRKEDTEKYQASDKPVKQLLVDVLEKFTPGYIRVATEIKPLIVNLDICLQSENLTANVSYERLQAEIKEKIVAYFDSHSLQINKRQLEAEITKISLVKIDKIEINLKPKFWQPGLTFNGDAIDISFVEKAEVGNLFIYNKILEITGAFKLTLPPTYQLKEKQEIYKTVRTKLEEYLANLQPEEKVKIEELVRFAKSVDNVLDVTWKIDDFQVQLDKKIETDRIDNQEIRVDKLEKPRLADAFAINSDIVVVNVEVTAITFKLSIIGAVFEDINKDKLKQLMQQAIANIFNHSNLMQNLPKLSVGQNLDYAQIKVNLLVLIRDQVRLITAQNIVDLITEQITTADKQKLADLTIQYLRNSDYNIAKLNLQSPNITLPTGDILIRSLERAQMLPISKNKVTVEIDIPPTTTILQPDVQNVIDQGKATGSRIPPAK